MTIVAFKIAIALATGLLGVVFLRVSFLYRVSERNFLCLAVAVQLLPAVMLFVALYVVGGQEPTSDVPAYYLPAAQAIRAGQLPYRDFPLSYAPLFPYVSSALLRVWNSGKVFALLDLALGVVTLVPWYLASRASFDVRTARRSAVLFATSGHLAVQSLLGTNQAWIAAALAGSVFLLTRGRGLASGLSQAVSLSVTKVLAAIFWPALWICAPHRLQWTLGAVLLSVCVYGAFAVLGADPLAALRIEIDFTSSGNFPYLLEPLLSAAGLPAQPISDALTLVALLGVFAWIYIATRALTPAERVARLYAALALTGLVFMIFSKKSFTGYVVFFMYPLVLVLRSSPAAIPFFLLLNVLLVAEPNLWFRLGGYDPPLHVWLRETHNVLVPVSFIAVDLLLLACYAWAAYWSVRRLGAPRAEVQLFTAAGNRADPSATCARQES